MKEIALKVGREVVKIICYLSIVGMILMGFGIFAVFFARQNYGGLFTLDYGYQSIQVSVRIPIVVLIMAMVIFYLLFRIMRALDKLLINFQDEEYFCSENINLLSKVLLYQILFTGIQLLVNISLNFSKIADASSLFDLSLKDYLVNIVFIIINDIAIIMLKRGYELQKDHDELI